MPNQGPSGPQVNNFMMENEDSGVNSSVQELIDMAKKDLEKNKEDHRKRKSSAKEKNDEDKDYNSADDEDSDDVSEESDEESESDEEENAMNEELVELTSEISLKQKLIEELETSQKRLHIMKQQYETKLLALEARITSTQEERDKVLKSIASKPGGDSAEKTNRIKQDYQEKLT